MIRENYVVFGASDMANKAVIAAKPDNRACAVIVADLNGTHERGDMNFPLDDVGSVYTTLYFCKRESLDGFIKTLRGGNPAL